MLIKYVGHRYIHGKVDDDLTYLEVGSIVHSRRLTLGNRILRYYVSLEEPPLNLEILVISQLGLKSNKIIR